MINGKEVSISKHVEHKLSCLNKTVEELEAILERNKDKIEVVSDGEDFLIEAEFGIVGYKTNTEIKIISVIKNVL